MSYILPEILDVQFELVFSDCVHQTGVQNRMLTSLVKAITDRSPSKRTSECDIIVLSVHHAISASVSCLKPVIIVFYGANYSD